MNCNVTIGRAWSITVLALALERAVQDFQAFFRGATIASGLMMNRNAEILDTK